MGHRVPGSRRPRKEECENEGSRAEGSAETMVPRSVRNPETRYGTFGGVIRRLELEYRKDAWSHALEPEIGCESTCG
jgi:hypothetical protein